MVGHEPQPLLAVIRAKCLDCVGYQPSEVRRCGDIKCPNWAYRMSANPFHRRELACRCRIGRTLMHRIDIQHAQW